MGNKEADDTFTIDGVEFPKRKTKRWVIGTLAAVFGSIAALRSYKIVSPGDVGVEIRLGRMVANDLEPGMHGKWPAFDKIYTFSQNTIISEVSGGANTASIHSKPNTKDQNFLTANFRFHYKIDNKSPNMALHAESIGGDNGKSLHQSLANDSVNAVVGSQLAVETLQNPEEFLRAFVKNFMWRLDQNQVPFKHDTIELLQLNAGGLTAPVQMRINVATGEIVKMSVPDAEAPAPGK